MSAVRPDPSGGLARNATLLTAGHVAGHALSIVLTVVVARGLGAAGFGQFALVGSVVLIGNVLTTFGTESYLVREIAARRGDPARLLTAALVLQLVLSAAFVTAVAAGAGWLPGTTAATGHALRIYILTLFPLAFSSVLSAALRAWERMDLSALLTVGTAALQAGVALAVVRAGGGLAHLVLALLVAQVTAAALGWALCRIARPGFALVAPAAAAASSMCVTMLKRTWPLALLGGLGVLNQRIGVLLLSFLAGDTSAGWYAAAFRIVEGLKLTHYAFLGALLPVAARIVADGLSDASMTAAQPLAGLVRRSRRVLLGLGVAAALGANLLATPIVLLLYGHAYAPAAAALRILAWSLVPFAAAAPTAMALVSTGHELVVVRIGALGVAVTLALGVMLIPMAGVNGACIATLVGEVVRCTWLVFETGRIAAPRLTANAAV